MNRRLHLILLAAAMSLWIIGPTVVRWLDWGWRVDPVRPASPFEFVFYWLGFAGAIHASTVAAAVRTSTSVGRKIAFVVVTGVLAFLIAKSVPHIGLSGDWFLAFMVASAGGAAAYWWLIRKMLLSTLPTKALVRAIWACPLATIAASLVSKPLGVDAFTLLWWLAFSSCLTAGMRDPMTANNSVQPTGENPPAADAAR